MRWSKILIKKGAKVNFANKNGDTALILAAFNSRHKVIEALIAAGADVNHKNNSGLSPLSLAQKNKAEAIIKSLKAAGAGE